MSKTNPLFSQLDAFKANLTRNGFSTNDDYTFSAAPGMLLPVYHRLLNPSETIFINFGANVVANPMIRPTFCNISHKVDVFFVPLTKLWTAFASVFSNSNDHISSSVIPDDLSLPLLNVGSLLAEIDPDGTKDSFFNYNLFYEPIRRQSALGRFGTRRDAFRLLMHLDLNPFVLYRYLEDFTPSSQLMVDRSNYSPSFFPYQLAAYQCIYQDWYRDDDREERDIFSYQLDYYTSAFNNDISASAKAQGLLALRYHQRPKDYFTSLRVSPIASTLNQLSDSLNFGNSLLDSYLSTNSTYAVNASGNLSSSPKDVTALSTNTNVRTSTSQLRSLFAVEKFMRIYGRSKKNYDSQVLAHFGTSVPRDVKHDISYLGSFEGGMSASPLYSMSNTLSADGSSGSSLGERSGNASASIKGRTIKFNAPCHGVLMAIYYCVPHYSYTQGYVTSKRNQITSLRDFYHPEFDRLGAQPLYLYENGIYNMNNGTSNQDVSAMSLGWQRRYMQWKTFYDRHSIAFRPRTNRDYQQGVTNDWSPWVISREPFDYYNIAYSGDSISDVTPAFYDFFVKPDSLNSLFYLGYQPNITDQVLQESWLNNPWLMFQGDPFMVALNFDEKLISTMSTTGEPSLDSMI